MKRGELQAEPSGKTSSRSGESSAALETQKTEDMVWEVTFNTRPGPAQPPREWEFHTEGDEGCYKHSRAAQRARDRETSCLVDRDVTSEL